MFGLIFQNLIADNMVQNGAFILRSDVWKYTAILGLAMLAGLLFALFITYRKPRTYEDKPLINYTDIGGTSECSRFTLWVISIAAISTFAVQLLTHSLPLGALIGLGIIFTTKVIPKSKMEFKS